MGLDPFIKSNPNLPLVDVMFSHKKTLLWERYLKSINKNTKRGRDTVRCIPYLKGVADHHHSWKMKKTITFRESGEAIRFQTRVFVTLTLKNVKNFEFPPKIDTLFLLLLFSSICHSFYFTCTKKWEKFRPLNKFSLLN